MKRPAKVAQESNDALNRRLDDQERRVNAAMRRLQQKIVDKATRLSTDDDGNLKGPRWTLKQAQLLHQELLNLAGDTMRGLADEQVNGFRFVMELTKRELRDLQLDATFATYDRDLLKDLAARNYRVYQTLSDQAVERVAEAVYSAIIAGDTFGQLTEQLRGIILPGTDVRGRSLQQYAGTYAHDQLIGYYRTLQLRKAEELGMDSYLYFGDVVRDSRPFCAQRAGRVFTEEQIKAWDNLSWAGKSGPPLTHCGGYRCRHHWFAVDPAWVEDGMIEVART